MADASQTTTERSGSTIGVLGGTSIVGGPLLTLAVRDGLEVLAVSRSTAGRPAASGVHWCQPQSPPPPGVGPITAWISLCPIWVVPDLIEWLEQMGIETLVAVSSMSIETKRDSPVAAERNLAETLAAAEDALTEWAENRGRRLVILRPTMIYDGVRDGNITAIAACVRRLGWFPLCGRAEGLRQPVHAGDVAAACLAAARHPAPARLYTLSGGEPLSFRELVARTCRAGGLPIRTVSLPAWAWNLAARVGRRLGVAAGLTVGAGMRMNQDLSCDHARATKDLGFQPRAFVPGGGTLGQTAAFEAARCLAGSNE